MTTLHNRHKLFHRNYRKSVHDVRRVIQMEANHGKSGSENYGFVTDVSYHGNNSLYDKDTCGDAAHDRKHASDGDHVLVTYTARPAVNDHVISHSHTTHSPDEAQYHACLPVNQDHVMDTCLDREDGGAPAGHVTIVSSEGKTSKRNLTDRHQTTYGAVSGELPQLEDLIGDVGGFGVYHVLLLTTLFAAKMAVSYSVLLMAFVGATPDWICLTHTSDIADGFSDDTQNETGFRQCAVNGTQCVNFRFSAAMTTIVTQWQLVCDKRWITSAITSVQMSGLLLGAAGCGQMADWWGRRNTVFLTLLVQAVFSLVGGFAPSWEFFAVCRFFTGMASGGFIVVYFPLPMEFLSPRWRSVQSAIPTWSMGIGVLSLVAYLLHDWRWLSWCGAVFSAIFLLAYPCTPESVRWLVLHDRLQEAENIIRNIVTVNRKSMPDMEIVRQVARAEQEREQKVGRKYTYLDLLRGWALIKTTLFFNFTWFCCGLVYYILSFGVEHLSGNLYMNMFLLSAVEIPAMMVTWILNNRLGRRWTCFLFFMISCLTACAVVVITYVMEESERGTAVNVLVMICKLGVAAAWPCMQVFATESFPTVIRSLGYGTCNVASRVGGIIAPYLVLLGASHVSAMYLVVAAMMGTSALVSLLCRETKGRALEDTIHAFLELRNN